MADNVELCLCVNIEALIADSVISKLNAERNLAQGAEDSELYIETIDYLLGQMKRSEAAGIKRVQGDSKPDYNNYEFVPSPQHRISLAEKFLFDGDENYFSGNGVSAPYVHELGNYAARVQRVPPRNAVVTPRILHQYCEKYSLQELEGRLWGAVTDDAVVDDVTSYLAAMVSIRKEDVNIIPSLVSHYCKHTGTEQFLDKIKAAIERQDAFKKEPMSR